jgi:hypothetical protein
MSLSAVRLQKVVEAIATHQLDDGTWHLDHKHASEFVNMITPYVKRAAYQSDKNDPDNACGEIFLHVWQALKRYGPRYQGLPFKNLLKTKVNNVLTNMYNQKYKTKKRQIDAKTISFLAFNAQDPDDNSGSMSKGWRNLPISAGRNAFNKTFTDPIDLICVKENLTNRQKAELEKLAAQEHNKMPHKLTVEEILTYVKRLPNNDKRTLLIDLWAMTSGVSAKNIIKLIFPIEKNNDPVGPIEYNVPVTNKVDFSNKDKKLIVEFDDVSEESEFMPSKAYVQIGSGDVGDQFVTPFQKKIEIVNKSSKAVKILILASDVEIEVPATYQVLPVPVADTAGAQDPVEAVEAHTNAERAVIPEPTKPTSMVGKDAESVADDDDDDMEYLNAPEEDAPVVVPEPPAQRVEASDVVNEPDPVKKKRRGRKKKTIAASDPEAVEKENPTPKKAKVSARKGTAKALVIDMLREKPQTRDTLAEAIIANQLTRNNNVQNVKNYVSVMISTLKSEGIGLTTVARGKWTIE